MRGNCVRVEGVEESLGQFAEGFPAGELGELFGLGAVQRLVEAGEPAGEGRERVFVAFAERDAEEERGEGDGGLALQRARLGLVALADADGVDDDEVGLGSGVLAGDGLQIGGREDARATAFHLLEKRPAADIAHEEEDFERLDVGAGGNHVDRDGDAQRG